MLDVWLRVKYNCPEQTKDSKRDSEIHHREDLGHPSLEGRQSVDIGVHFVT